MNNLLVWAVVVFAAAQFVAVFVMILRSTLIRRVEKKRKKKSRGRRNEVGLRRDRSALAKPLSRGRHSLNHRQYQDATCQSTKDENSTASMHSHRNAVG